MNVVVQQPMRGKCKPERERYHGNSEARTGRDQLPRNQMLLNSFTHAPKLTPPHIKRA